MSGIKFVREYSPYNGGVKIIEAIHYTNRVYTYLASEVPRTVCKFMKEHPPVKQHDWINGDELIYG